MTSAEDDYSSYSYTYDNLGRITVIDVDNVGPEVQLVQAYNAVGSRTSLATGWDDGGGFDDDFQNVYTYDNLQRLTRVDQIGVMGGNTVAEKRVDFAYNAAGQFTSITRYKDTDGGGTHLVATTTYGYDNIGRLTDLTQTHDTTTIADYDWTFDAYSRITSLSFTSLVGNDGDSDYTYDNTGQLTDADHDYQTDESYSYDENGNRTIGSYSTGDNNLLSTDGTYNYTYDDEGNRVLKTNISTGDHTEYEWDHRNRLVKITQKNSSNVITHEVEYTYDVFNRRITKEIDADGAGGGGVDTIQYIYDNDDIILAFDGSDALTNRYLHGAMVDQILADEDALGDVLWPLADNLGSIRDIADSTGSVVNHITYDAYGTITSETASTVIHAYAYTGRERDYESDLQFNRARYYASTIGQWISEDPIGFDAGDTNVRRYVHNRTPFRTDPSGMYDAVDSIAGFLNGATMGLYGWYYEATTGQFIDAPSYDDGTIRGEGALKVAAGAGEASIGAGLVVGGGAGEVGTVGGATPVAVPTMIIGGGLFVHGSDVTGAGVRQIWSGRRERTLTGLALDNLTGDPATSDHIEQSVAGGACLAGGGTLAMRPRPILPKSGPAAAIPLAQAGETQTLARMVPGIADDAIVNFGATARTSVAPATGRSYWWRWGDIKHLTPRQVQTLVGDLASAGTDDGMQVVRVAATNSEGFTQVASVAGYVEYVAEQAVAVARSISLYGG